MTDLPVTETAEERRRRHLNDLIELEGGPKRAAGKKPGHYVIAERVHEYENSSEDSTQMAQALRQVAQGKRNLGHMTARRIETAYKARGLYGITHGWFDQPLVNSSESPTPSEDDDAADAPKGLRDLLVGLALALPGDYSRCLGVTESLPFSASPTQFAYRSTSLVILPVIWSNPPLIEDDRHYTPLYPLTVYRAIVRLAAWGAADRKHGGQHRCIVAVVGGATTPRSAPMEVYYQAQALGVEVFHYQSAEHLATNIRNWDRNPR